MLVEGEDDKFAIIELMGHHTHWPNDKTKAPVYLQAIGSANDILADGFIPLKLQESGTKVLGVVLDADVEFDRRWARVKQVCRSVFDDVPDDMPKRGLILQDQAEGPRFGVWIMPDNQHRGMLETFLQALIYERSAPLLAYAKSVVLEARAQSAPCREAHIAKAEIHTWLAWQDPPGQAFGRAITSLTLDPQCAAAEPFVSWFLNLYRLERLGTC